MPAQVPEQAPEQAVVEHDEDPIDVEVVYVREIAGALGRAANRFDEANYELVQIRCNGERVRLDQIRVFQIPQLLRALRQYAEMAIVHPEVFDIDTLRGSLGRLCGVYLSYGDQWYLNEIRV